MRVGTAACALAPLFAVSLSGTDARAQLRHIDPAKLPQDGRIQKIYSDLLPVEPMVHSWSSTWSHATPKEQVTSLLASSLHDLKVAETENPKNAELFLLTGLVAHFAYNVDVETPMM